IRHVDIAICRESDVVRLVHVRLIFSSLVRCSDRHQDLSVRAELSHSLRLRIDHPQVPIMVETDRVRVFKHSFTPGLYELALRLVHLNGDLATIKGPNVSIRSYGHTGHCGPLTSGWLFQWPIRIDLIPNSIVNPRIGHWVLRLREDFSGCNAETNCRRY